MINPFSVSQINARHHFLARFIGTKDEEDISFNKANEVNLWVTTTTCVCCILEIILYFAYNRLVNIGKILQLEHFIILGSSVDINKEGRSRRDREDDEIKDG